MMSPTTKLIIDTDPGVDDAMAILYALAAPGITVQALTTVDGNASLEQAIRNAATVLEVAGRTDIPIYRGSGQPLVRRHEPSPGSHGADGLGDAGMRPSQPVKTAGDAIEYLVDSVRRQAGEVTIVALGPLTNVARAILADPGFAAGVRELVLMGGSRGAGNVTPSAEFNIWHDPDAARIVFRAGIERITMVGLDATSQVHMGPIERELLHLVGTEQGRFLHAITRVYADAHWRRARILGSEMCDPLAMAHLIAPEVLTLIPAEVEVETDGASIGRTLVWPVDQYRDRQANAMVALAADPRQFFQSFMRTTFGGFDDAVDTVLGPSTAR